jgi:hypothetical protein
MYVMRNSPSGQSPYNVCISNYRSYSLHSISFPLLHQMSDGQKGVCTSQTSLVSFTPLRDAP